MYIDHHLCLLQAVVLQFGEVLTAFPKCSVWGWVPPMAFSVNARSCNAVFSSIDYSFRMRVYYTCHCADLSHPFSLFHLAYAENILGVCLLCQSKKGTGLLLNVDLPTFPVAFFQKYCLGAGWELFLGVQFRVFCAVLQAALSLDELDIEHRNVLLFFLPERAVFRRTAWPWVMLRTVKQNIFVQDLDFLCWVFFSTWHHGWWQQVARNTWKMGLRSYSSPLLGLCAGDTELTPVCCICTFALDLQQDSNETLYHWED